MLALYASHPDAGDPLSAVRVGERPEPVPPPGWVRIRMAAGALNRHDLWTLRGVGIPASQFPMVLGCEGAGVLDDGTPVVVYPVVADAARYPDETVDPHRSLFTERHQGLLAEYAVVPARNAVPYRDRSVEEAAVLGVTYLTAYRMLFTRSGVRPGDTVLVQGASGGVSTALVQLGRAAGLRVWATSRSEAGRARALALGADAAYEPGARLPERVDAVLESVGEPTWAHSLRAVRPGGVVVCCGATGGAQPPADLQRVFFQQISVVGSTMGTLDEFRSLMDFLATTGTRPVVDEQVPLQEAPDALRRMDTGAPGKIVVTVGSHR
ncbi:zinc-binding dehydrogenase [Nakamurella endophytica]|uniref:Zn-dependent oxidoreductase n=1 Tax=Nakamurella endophytica TaxID=1748367 RepID=A0A917SIR4_9ACTN|nr:zinc-binding dehydrogenase [Nakamurella endophytica]GGL84495.1 Zn-dependent oxidoreductase [Nakamurella endophytica]